MHFHGEICELGCFATETVDFFRQRNLNQSQNLETRVFGKERVNDQAIKEEKEPVLGNEAGNRTERRR